MPKLVVIDGPEKSGKSYVLDRLEARAVQAGYAILKHHWNRYQPQHWTHKRVLTDQLETAELQEKMTGRKVLILWNRSQASEAIYSQLLGRKSALADNPLLGEFLYGRAQLTLGPRVILLGPDLATISRLRDQTDHPVDPATERERYREYGNAYGWLVLENEHTEAYAEALAAKLLENIQARPEIDIRTYVGPLHPDVLVLSKPYRNDWVPFTNKQLYDPLVEAGPQIMGYGYANTETNRQLLLGAKRVVISSNLQPFTRTFARYYLGYEENQLRSLREFLAETGQRPTGRVV